jgi:hypothetical protein
MPSSRFFAASVLVAGAASALSAGPAAAVTVAPVPGGMQVDLTHNDTVWVSQTNVGGLLAGVPNVAVQSFGQTLTALSGLASLYPQGRVAFTVVGPLNSLNGTMEALAQ